LLAVLSLAATGAAARADTWTSTEPVPAVTSCPPGHALATLPEGEVLMVGGGPSQPEREVRAWDPRSERWRSVEPLPAPRTHPGAVALPDGRLLVVGGWSDVRDHHNPAPTAELRDPRTGRWQATGRLMRGRMDPSLLLLPDGRVLVMGGEQRTEPCTFVPEIWDPHTGLWSARAELPGRCGRPAVALLSPGRILVTGGLAIGPQRLRQATAEANVFEVATNRWTAAPHMLRPRDGHRAVPVKDGVLVVGGDRVRPTSEPHAELLTRGASGWRAIATSAPGEPDAPAVALPAGEALVILARGHTQRWSAERAELVPGADLPTVFGPDSRAVLLHDGRVFLTAPPSRVPLLWSPAGAAVGTWSQGKPPDRVFFYGTSTELPGDRVLLVGGEAPHRSEATVQLGDLRAGTWQLVAPLSIPRSRHTATALPGGAVLVVGGMDAAAEEQPRSSVLADLRAPRPSKAFVRTAELWQQNRWVKSGELSVGRSNHTASLLADGRVLVAGGVYYEFGPKGSGHLEFSPPRFVAQSEIWSPAGRWQLAAPLHRARAYHTATSLPDGRVLVAGGAGVSGTLSADDAVAELWDSGSGQWSLAGSLQTPRYDHTATLLPDGRVLVAGGRRSGGNVGGVSTSEVWDPKLRTWRELGRLNIPRYGHHAVLLPGGRVLVAGGYRDESTPLRQAELWDPRTGRWTLTATMPTDGSVASVAPFPGGRALLISPGAALLFNP
jgi:hypothetical protein